MIAATFAGMTGDDARPNLGLHDGGHFAIGHGAGVGHPGHDPDVAGGLVVEHEPAIGDPSGVHGGTGLHPTTERT